MRKLGHVFLFGLALSVATHLDAQSVVRFTLNAADVAAGRSNLCDIGLRSPKAGTSDSIHLDIAKDKSTSPLVYDHTPVDIRITVDDKLAGTLPAGKDSVTLTSPFAPANGRVVSIWRVDASQPLCSTTPTAASATVIRDTLLRRLVMNDSAQTDSMRTMQRMRGSSFVILSLIKSIAGEIPRDEFFDLRLKFGGERVPPRGRHDAKSLFGLWQGWTPYFTAASVDISLSTRSDTTGADSLRKRLTDAGLSANYIVAGDSGPVPRRVAYLSGLFKIFNTKSYVGGGLGGLELRGSRLEGSWVRLSWLYRVYNDSVLSVAATKTLAPNGRDSVVVVPAIYDFPTPRNLFLEFYVRVPNAQFLDRLRIRGGILFPLDRTRRPESRIVLSVPVVDLDRF